MSTEEPSEVAALQAEVQRLQNELARVAERLRHLTCQPLEATAGARGADAAQSAQSTNTQEPSPASSSRYIDNSQPAPTKPPIPPRTSIQAQSTQPSAQAPAQPAQAPAQTLQLPQLVPQPPQPVPMAATRVVMHQIVLPSEVDRLGICFGGQVLSWIDICAGLSAKTLARGPCVTATLDAVHFLRPCKLGSVVIVAAMVNRTFNTSMEVGVHVESEDMRTGVRHHCCRSGQVATATALVSQHHDSGISRQPSLTAPSPPPPPQPSQVPQSPPAPVLGGAARPVLPRVVPTTADHARVHEEAEARRQRRLAERQRLRSDPHLAAQLEMCRLTPITHRDGGPTLPPSITAPWLSDTHAHHTHAYHTHAHHTHSHTKPTSQPHSTSANTAVTESCPDQGSGIHAEQLQGAGTPQSMSVAQPLPDIGQQSNTPHLQANDVHTLTGQPGQPVPGTSQGSSNDPGQGTQVLPPAPPSFSHARRVASTAWFRGLLSPETDENGHHEWATAAGGGGGHAGVEGGSVRIPVSPNLTVAYMTQSILPQHANTLGITFGGQVMSWMEMCAYISASRLRSPHLLTAAIDSLTFARSTRVGDILYVTSQVTAIFGSSLEVQVSVHGEDPQVGELFHCADGYVTIVTVAAEDSRDTGRPRGSPVSIPFVLQPTTPSETFQAEAALRRRDDRLKLRTHLAAKSGARAAKSPPTHISPAASSEQVHV